MSVLRHYIKTYFQENFSVFQTSSNLLPQSYSLLLSLLTPWMKYGTPEKNMKP